jgi:putative DNA primase/helicase
MLKDFLNWLSEEGISYNLLKPHDRNAFIEEVLIFLQKRKIEFNEDPYLLPFENGILELKTGEFRDTKPEEMILETTGYTYEIPEDEGRLAFEFLNKMFKDKTELKCVLNFLSLSLEDVNRNEYIIFFIGEKASNGKSTILNIMNSILGNFGLRFNTNILCASREKAEVGNPAMLSFKNKRFSYCSEPDENKKININVVKEITGDVLAVRGLYSNEQEEFKNNSTMFLCCQYPPELEKVDDGIKRRIITIPFNVQFVDKPDGSIYQEQKIEVFTKEEKQKLRNSFLNLLVSNYIDLAEHNFKFEIPQSFMNCKNEYIEQNSLIDQFILNRYEYNEGTFISSFDISNDLREFTKNPKEIKNKLKKLLNVDSDKKSGRMVYMNIRIKQYEDELQI